MAFVQPKPVNKHGVQDVTSEFKGLTKEFKNIACFAAIQNDILDKIAMSNGSNFMAKHCCNDETKLALAEITDIPTLYTLLHKRCHICV